MHEVAVKYQGEGKILALAEVVLLEKGMAAERARTSQEGIRISHSGRARAFVAGRSAGKPDLLFPSSLAGMGEVPEVTEVFRKRGRRWRWGEQGIGSGGRIYYS